MFCKTNTTKNIKKNNHKIKLGPLQVGSHTPFSNKLFGHLFACLNTQYMTSRDEKKKHKEKVLIVTTKMQSLSHKAVDTLFYNFCQFCCFLFCFFGYLNVNKIKNIILIPPVSSKYNCMSIGKLPFLLSSHIACGTATIMLRD